MLALCTLSTETAEQLKASSALLPALPKLLLQASQPLSMTISGKEEVGRQPSNEHSNKICADANAYHTFMSSVHGPKIISFIFHSSVINMVFISSWDYPRLTGCCRGELQYYDRCDKTRNFLYTSFPLGQLHSHKMDNDKDKGNLLWGPCLPTRSQFMSETCPFL